MSSQQQPQQQWMESPASPAVSSTPPVHPSSAPPVAHWNGGGGGSGPTSGGPLPQRQQWAANPNPSYYSAQQQNAWQGGYSPQQQQQQRPPQYGGYGSQSPQQQQQWSQQGYGGRAQQQSSGWSQQASPRSGGYGYAQQYPQQQRQYSQQEYGRRGAESGFSAGSQRNRFTPNNQSQQPQRYGGGGGGGGAGGGNSNRGSSGGSGGPPAAPMDSKPFALALHGLACRFAGRPVSSPQSDPLAAATVATIQRNITSFSSLNPLQRSLAPEAFATHTLRGHVYRNAGMPGHGSVAIVEVGGVALPHPWFVWGMPEVRIPQARFDRPDLVDFAAVLPAGDPPQSDANPPPAPVATEFVVRRRAGGRVYTIFKYPSSAAPDAPTLLCVKRVDNSPYWKLDEHPSNSSPGPGSGSGPANNAGLNQINTDACNLRMVARLEQMLAASPSRPPANGAADSAAPSPIEAALSTLQRQHSLQSLTFEWSGRELGDEDSLCDPALLHHHARMEPMYFTANDGAVTLCVEDSVPASAAAAAAAASSSGAVTMDLTAPLLRGSFDASSPASGSSLRALVGQVLAHDSARNDAHRAAHPEFAALAGLGGERFAEVGRDLYFVAAAPAGSAVTGPVVVRRMSFALEPAQVVAAHDQAQFSPALEGAIRACLAQLRSEQRSPAALALAPGQALPSWAGRALLAKLAARGVPPRRLSSVKLNVLAYASTVLQAQTAKAQASRTPSNKRNNTMQRMLVLVAFPGAGKSYFSDRLVQATARSNAAAVAAAQSAAAAAAVSSTPLSSPVAPLLDSATSPLDSSAATSASPDDDGFIAAPSSRGGKARNVSVVAPPAPGVVPQWVRINQDALGSRKQCELFAEKALKEGHSVIIDRTNIDIAQRSTWVGMAQRFGLAHVEALFLAVPVAVCKQRVLDRINHETLPATAASLSIVDRFLNDMVPPILEEGFSRVHVLQRSDDPAVQQQHVEELLVAVQSPPPPVQP